VTPAIEPLSIDTTPPAEVSPETVPPAPVVETPINETAPVVETPAVTEPPAEVAAPAAEPPPAFVSHNAAIYDESEELLAIDRSLADNIYANGPLSAYTGVISSEGVLYDASGGSPSGLEATQFRFGTFPTGFILERRPEKAMASSGAGSSWGGYSLKRGNVTVSDGRYVAIWRKENGAWKIVTELAAGRSQAPAALPPRPTAPRPAAQGNNGVPVMRDALGRPVPAVGPRVDPATNPEAAPN
jgi:hypothetical protein